MRPGQQNKRGRGRGNNNNGGGGGGGNNNFNRKGGNPLSRTYDSSGPDIKIRGTAQHIAEKYSTLARDAQSSGDRVMAENYLQHAEHYNRIIAAAQAQMQDRFQHQDRGDYQDRDGNSVDQDDMDGGEGDDLGYAPQPMVDEGHQPQQQQRRENNQQRREPQAQDGQQDGQPQERQDRQSQDRPARENNRRDQRRDRRQDRPDRQDRNAAQASEQAEDVVAAPVAVAPAPVASQDDGSGPQPVIEGVPAEVAVEQETQGEAAPRRRRSPAARPRRPRRGEGADEGGDDAKPELADAGE
ncbi:DUF4167 domain-containing protein [Neorhizobium alkalisoli]|uniref:Uncharacterized protein DUF4167 n=1 Tax=Neorhizobium alkalisoli TaxID=528178 RepID=A0A561QJ47_9HYPH|nr:DUF4167 domain-containing protein [Neorhizobium alkalisoli]TWF50393.1 uncharacterized protein DUF4167 [Neorhizobium alkalisoli]